MSAKKNTILIIFLLLSSIFIIFNTQTVNCSGENWLIGWNYRKSHEIINSTNAGNNYQVIIIVHYDEGTDLEENVYLGGNCQTDFGDIRFTDDDGETELDYWIENLEDSNNAIIWVKINDNLSSENQIIYIYYGNSEVSTTSNINSIFKFWDGFETYTGIPDDNSADSHPKWDITSEVSGIAEASITVVYEKLASLRCRPSVSAPTSSFGAKRSKTEFSFIVEKSDVVDFYYKEDNTYSWAKIKIMNNSDLTILQETTLTDQTSYTQHIESINDYEGYTVRIQLEGGTSRSGYGYSTYFDKLLVRKYVTPEPAHSTWGIAEQYTEEDYTTNEDFNEGFIIGGLMAIVCMVLFGLVIIQRRK